MSHSQAWRPSSWRDRTALQMPSYPDTHVLRETERRLSGLPSLIFPGESAALRERLAAVARGEAFLLQGGDCAESFDDLGADVRDSLPRDPADGGAAHLRGGVPVVKVGRIAGPVRQAALVRRRDAEAETLPSYRGDIVNGASSRRARAPGSAAPAARLLAFGGTLNLLRALAQGGFADLHEVHRWTSDFVRNSPQGERFEAVASTSRGARLHAGLRIRRRKTPQLHQVEFFTSHEALLLHYEEALTRRDDASGRGTAARPTCCGSASARARWTARMSSSCAASRTRSASSSVPTPSPTTCCACSTRSTRATSRRPHWCSSRAWAPTRCRAPAGPDRSRAARRPQRGVVLRPDARQHRDHIERLQDARLRPHPREVRELLRRARGRRAATPAACISR